MLLKFEVSKSNSLICPQLQQEKENIDSFSTTFAISKEDIPI